LRTGSVSSKYLEPATVSAVGVLRATALGAIADLDSARVSLENATTANAIRH
jgi:hypothetical protein